MREVIPSCRDCNSIRENIIQLKKRLVNLEAYFTLKKQLNGLERKIEEDATFMDSVRYVVETPDLGIWKQVSSFAYMGDAQAEINSRKAFNPNLVFRIVKVTRDSEVVVSDDSEFVTTANLNFNKKENYYGAESIFGI